MTIESQICAACGASLPDGVTDVLCPVCALQGALVENKQNQGGTLRRWFRFLPARKSEVGRHEIPLATDGNEGRQAPTMTGVAPEPGESIGDYEIIERIGGNLGLVFKARHLLLNKVVALKLVPADRFGDPAHLARFQREIRVMGQLEHPNLVSAVDARSVEDWHLVAMPLIDGIDLQQLVRSRGPLPIADACEVARQAAQGLQFAHEHGLIHRDIKPSNLMLTRKGTVKVIDLGLALVREDSTAQLTQTGLVLGTMSYCAPEQFRDASHVDIRADIYSLGCTLYHLMTGKAPYAPRRSFPEIVQAHLHEPFPVLTEARPDSPKELDAVLARMTAKDREARYSTPGEVVEALESFAHEAALAPLVPAAMPRSPERRATGGKMPTPHTRPRATNQLQRVETRWGRRAAVFALLLAVAVGVITFALRSPTPSSPGVVVILMDTMAPKGIYDDDNRRIGRSNAKELIDPLQKALEKVFPNLMIHEVPVDLDWHRYSYVRSFRPALIVIHRSVFYHPTAAALDYKYPPFDSHAEFELFQQRYNVLGDGRLITFLDYIANAVPEAQFLVYSRGTDTNWVSREFRKEWVKETETRFRALEGRMETMLIPKVLKDGIWHEGTFRDPATKEALLRRVKEMLRVSNQPERRDRQSP